jgi:hypothetical protein
VTVLDYETGCEVFSRNAPQGSVVEGSAFFAGEDRLVVPLWSSQFGIGRDTRLEIWNLSGEPRLENTVEQTPFRTEITEIRNGRFVVQPANWPNFKVFDAVEGRAVFTAPDDQATPTSPQAFRATLSAVGDRVLGGSPTSLWDVDSGAVLWRQRDHETGSSLPSRREFRVREQWHKLWEAWLPSINYETTAYRRFRDGRLLFRTRSGGKSALLFWDSAGTLAVLNDGTVYHLPPPVNYPLLALCQTILALPLILIWAVLRWRRKRRLRMARVSP